MSLRSIFEWKEWYIWKKTENIIIRVTEEQHRIIKEEAEENNTTISALLLRRFKNNVTVYLDTSDYRDLVIQV